MPGMLRAIARVAALITCVMLGGCWDAEKELIPDSAATDPFDGARYVLYTGDGSDTLLERRPGKFAVFDVFDPARSEKDKKGIRFYEITDFFSFFGPDQFVVGNLQGYTYFERDGEDWTMFLPEDHQGRASSLEDLVAKAKAAREKGIVKPKDTVIFASIDTATAIALKQRQQAEHDRKKQAEELAERERVLREREEQLRAEQVSREHAQQQRIAQLEAELAAKRGGVTQGSTAQTAADDREPTEAEMSAAIRGTVAGAMFNVSVTKLGGCRKKAAYDYVCRYRWMSVNWGNFWKDGNYWYFQIVKDDP